MWSRAAFVCRPVHDCVSEYANALNDLLQRKADIAIHLVRPERLDSKRIVVIPLGLHAPSLARRDVPASMEDLRDHGFIGNDAEMPAIRAIAQSLTLQTVLGPS